MATQTAVTISIVIATYGDDSWRDLAWSRAYPSAQPQGADEIIVHHEPDLAIGPARNAAAKQATSEWLCFLDADDELADGYIDGMRRELRRYRGKQRPILQPQVSYVINGRAQPPKLLPKGDLRDDNYLVVGALVNRNLFNQVDGFSDYPHGFEDWSLWAKCWKAGATVVPCRRAVYIAHVNRNSAHRIMWRDRRQQLEMHKRVRQELFPEHA